mgnify:FL=1
MTLTWIAVYKELIGKGIEAAANGITIKLGSLSFVDNEKESSSLETAIHVSVNGNYKGKYLFKNAYRPYMKPLFDTLNPTCQLAVLSGDNEGEKEFLQQQLPDKVQLLFNQKPEDKLEYIKLLQAR